MINTELTPKEIKEWRQDLGLTQSQSASIVGVGLRMWQKYELDHPCKQLYIDLIHREMLNRKSGGLNMGCGIIKSPL
jgi:hypothetical protein